MNFRVMRREKSHIIRIFIICVTLNLLVKKPFLPRIFLFIANIWHFFLCPQFCIRIKWNCVNSKENIPGQIKSDEQKPRERYHISIYLDRYYEIKGRMKNFMNTSWNFRRTGALVFAFQFPTFLHRSKNSEFYNTCAFSSFLDPQRLVEAHSEVRKVG